MKVYRLTLITIIATGGVEGEHIGHCEGSQAGGSKLFSNYASSGHENGQKEE